MSEIAHTEQSASPGWVVMEQTDYWVLIGVDEEDDERVVVYPRIGDVSYVYRCAVCGWAKACQEGCHS